MLQTLLLFTAGLYVSYADLCSKGDIIFLLDNSGSIGMGNFTRMKTFVTDVVSNFDIGPDRVQVGLLTFESAVRSAFQLKSHRTKQQVYDAVKHVQYIGGGTNTGEALKYVRTTGFSTSNGHRNGVAKVVIVVTDGLSADEDQTKAEALKAHKAGISVFSIGIGSDYKLSELRHIASDPDDKHVFTVKEFVGLKWLKSTVASETCRSLTSPKGGCSGSVADIVFLLDSSGSVGTANFRKMISFTKDIIKSLPISSNSVRIGVDIYHTPVTHAFTLGRYMSQAGMLKHLDTLKFSGGETNTGKALRFLRQDSFSSASGARTDPNIPKIAIVVTDGRSNRKNITLQEAINLKKSHGGIKVMAVGIGEDIDFEELKTIASDSSDDQDYSMEVKDFDSLKHLEPLILKRICKRTPRVCMGVSDVVFLVDGSCSVGQENFGKVKHFVNDVINNLYIHNTGIQVGIESYACKPRHVFGLNTFTDRVKIQYAVNQMDYEKGGTDTGEALKYMRLKSFHESKGARPNAKKIGVVITDGDSKSKARTFYQAHKAKEAGIKLVTVGVGKEFIEELQGIASEPDSHSSKYLFISESYDALRGFTKNVTDIACKE